MSLFDNRLKAFLSTGEYVPAEDESPTDLEKHDKRFHPKGYKEGDSCKYRDELAKKDKADEGVKPHRYVPAISLSGAIPMKDIHFVLKSPGSREVLMSDGTFKSYDKLGGWDRPVMTTKARAEELAFQMGGAAGSDRDLSEKSKWYWIRKGDDVMVEPDVGNNREKGRFAYLGDLHNTSADAVLTTRDLDQAKKLAAEYGGEVESAPDWKLDKFNDRLVYEGYSQLPPRQSASEQRMQTRLQKGIDAILGKHGLSDYKMRVGRKRDGSSDEFSVAVYGPEKDAGIPEYISSQEIYADLEDKGVQTVNALRAIGAFLTEEGLVQLTGLPGYGTMSPSGGMWRKSSDGEGNVMFYTNASTPQHLKQLKERYGTF